MDLVEIGHRTVRVGDVAELGDRGDVAVHRVDDLEGDQLGPGRGRARRACGRGPRGRCGRRSLARRRLWRMPSIIEAWLLASESTTQPGMLRGQRAQRRPVRDVARGEQEGRLLAVQVGELALEQHVVVVGAGDVAGAAGAGAAAVDRLVHGVEHGRVLAHAEIVVRAPDRDLAAAAVAIEGGAGEVAGVALEVGEDPVAALPGGGRRAGRGRRPRSSCSPPNGRIRAW